MLPAATLGGPRDLSWRSLISELPIRRAWFLEHGDARTATREKKAVVRTKTNASSCCIRNEAHWQLTDPKIKTLPSAYVVEPSSSCVTSCLLLASEITSTCLRAKHECGSERNQETRTFWFELCRKAGSAAISSLALRGAPSPVAPQEGGSGGLPIRRAWFLEHGDARTATREKKAVVRTKTNASSCCIRNEAHWQLTDPKIKTLPSAYVVEPSSSCVTSCLLLASEITSTCLRAKHECGSERNQETRTFWFELCRKAGSAAISSLALRGAPSPVAPPPPALELFGVRVCGLLVCFELFVGCVNGWSSCASALGRGSTVHYTAAGP